MYDLDKINFNGQTPISEVMSHANEVLSKQLRDYQLEATTRAVRASMRHTKPILIEIPTGGGKSWICVSISYVMALLFKRAGHEKRRTLVICPNKTLVGQNAEKLQNAGANVSIFCATLDIKDTSGEIIVGSPKSIANAIDIFLDLNVGCVIVDEAHGHVGVSQDVVAKLKAKNPHLREFGMTATPFRTVEKYIYRQNTYKGEPPLSPEYAMSPYYEELVYQLPGEKLVEDGHLVPMVIMPIGRQFDTSALVVGVGGKFTSESERRVFDDYETNDLIITDMITSGKGMKSIMIFCQNIRHADIVYSILLKKSRYKKGVGSVGIYHSGLSENDAQNNLLEFNQGKHRYLVSVRSLTTGYDNQRVDALAILCSTESPGLLTQILGRGMRAIQKDRRLKKNHCRVLDYGENIQCHFPSGNLFSPEVVQVGDDFRRKTKMHKFHCPVCEGFNEAAATKFHPHLTEVGFSVNAHGYFLTPEGEVLRCSETGVPVAFHKRTQCQGTITNDGLHYESCKHRWAGMLCLSCGVLCGNNDTICHACGEPLTIGGGRQGGAILNPVAFEGDNVLRNSKVESMFLSFLTKVDKQGDPYTLGALNLHLKRHASLIIKDGEMTLQQKIDEKVTLYFNDHYDYIHKNKFKKEMIMNALWSRVLTMDEAKRTTISRRIQRIEYVWTTSNDRKFAEPITLSSAPIDVSKDN